MKTYIEIKNLILTTDILNNNYKYSHKNKIVESQISIQNKNITYVVIIVQ